MPTLREIFLGLQGEMRASLNVARTAIDHPGTKGDASEADWLKLLTAYLPTRYKAAKAFVLDSLGTISQQIDVVIYDNQYSPLLLKRDGALYVAAESVYAILEAKQGLSKAHIEYAGVKAESVRKLHRTSVPIPHVGGISEPKKLHHILAGIVGLDAEWVPQNAALKVEEINLAMQPERQLDLGCAISHLSFVREGGKHINSKADDALIFFFLQLLARLQAVGTVPALDFAAYAQAVDAGPLSPK